MAWNSIHQMATRYETLTRAARLAGEVVRSTPQGNVRQKSSALDVVTPADIASQQVIVNLIQSNFPHDVILSEEMVKDLGDVLSVPRLWVIDPLDGSTNHSRQRGYTCISAAYVEKGVVMAGAVYDIHRDETYHAERGQGAYIDNQRVTVSSQSELSQATIATENSYNRQETGKILRMFLKSQAPWILTRGSAVLSMCEVASGRVDLFYHKTVLPWDNAAAFLLAEEAGGITKGLKGQDITFISPEVVMGNSNLVKQWVDVQAKRG